jgi:hypothetical protein
VNEPGGAGSGGGGVSGNGGTTFPCPTVSNDPACHPADAMTYSEDLKPIAARCTPGLTCHFVVSNTAPTCANGYGIQYYTCCPVPLPTTETGTAFVAVSSPAGCPKPQPNQDPACTVPLADTCSKSGLTCVFISADGDVGFLSAFTCCHGGWVQASTCPSDAGAD